MATEKDDDLQEPSFEGFIEPHHGPVLSQWIIDRTDLSLEAKVLLAYIQDLSIFFGRNGGVFRQSRPTMAKNLHLGFGQVKRALEMLVEVGLLIRATRVGTTSVYRIDKWAACKVPPDDEAGDDPGSPVTRVASDPGRQRAGSAETWHASDPGTRVASVPRTTYKRTNVSNEPPKKNTRVRARGRPAVEKGGNVPDLDDLLDTSPSPRSLAPGLFEEWQKAIGHPYKAGPQDRRAVKDLAEFLKGEKDPRAVWASMCKSYIRLRATDAYWDRRTNRTFAFAVRNASVLLADARGHGRDGGSSGVSERYLPHFNDENPVFVDTRSEQERAEVDRTFALARLERERNPGIAPWIAMRRALDAAKAEREGHLPDPAPATDHDPKT